MSRPATGMPVTAMIGAAVWLAGNAQFLLAQVIVGSAWPSGYSWAANNISDLGNVHCQMWDDSRPRYVCSPLHALMNTSFVVQGLLLLAGLLLTGGACWGKGWLQGIARTLLAIDAGGYVLVGLVPADLDENLHLLGALLIMGAGNIGLLLAAFVPRPGLFRDLRTATLAIGLVAVAGAALFFTQHDPGIGLGGTERVAVFTLEAWTLVMAVAVLRARRRPRPGTGAPLTSAPATRPR
ncbi:DUF998 domain-containing protein [Nonomuraea sp. NPDC000554]|uniref:DUF998 domain-containing protein n=1 Tax=Nonomuraea sp. NPDC000554 TaxID=3154259 RepID=UPI003316DCED